MSIIKLLTPALCAFALTAGTFAHEPVETLVPSATLPCEFAGGVTPPPPTTPTPVPGAPQNLRIIGSGGDPEPDSVEGSGPFVDESVSEPAAAAGPHDYYLMLAARADCLRAYSLRDPAQLDYPKNGGFAHSNTRPLVVTYDPANDPDPRRQDAAKVVVGTGSNSLVNQVRVAIPKHAPESLLVTWDVWFGAEWEYGTAGIPDYKTFQFGSPYHDIHMEVRNRFAMSPQTAGLIDGRLYPEGGYSQGPNVSFADTLQPRVGTFHVQPERWTRYWAYFEAPSVDQWYRYSLWAADASTGPVLIYDRLQVRPSPQSTSASWESFWLEFNTSTAAVKPGRPSLVAYVRNVVALKGTARSSVTPLLVRP